MLPLMLFLVSTPTIFCVELELPYRPYTDDKTEEENNLGDESSHTHNLNDVLFAPVKMTKYNKPIVPVPKRKHKDPVTAVPMTRNTKEPRYLVPAYSKITKDVKQYHSEPRKSSMNQHNKLKPSAIVNNKYKIGARHEYKPVHKKKGDRDFHILPYLYDDLSYDDLATTVETTDVETVLSRTEEPKIIGMMSGPSESKNENKLLASEMRYPGVFIDYRRKYNTDSLGSVDVQVTTNRPLIETSFHPLSHKLYLKQYPEYKKPKILRDIKIAPYESYRYNAIDPGDSLPIFKHMHQKDSPTLWRHKGILYKNFDHIFDPVTTTRTFFLTNVKIGDDI